MRLCGPTQRMRVGLHTEAKVTSIPSLLNAHTCVRARSSASEGSRMELLLRALSFCHTRPLQMSTSPTRWLTWPTQRQLEKRFEERCTQHGRRQTRKVNDLLDCGDDVVDVVRGVCHAYPSLRAAELPSDAPIHHAHLSAEARCVKMDIRCHIGVSPHLGHFHDVAGAHAAHYGRVTMPRFRDVRVIVQDLPLAGPIYAECGLCRRTVAAT
jgi:hypothetical protein